MAICRDPVLSYLNDQGYNVVRLPRSGIEPLDVLGRDGGRVERLGTLSQIWTSKDEVPPVSEPQLAAAIASKTTGELKPSIGLRLLSDVLKSLGATGPELDFAYRKARSIKLSFTDIEAVSIDPLIIGTYLASGDLDTRNPMVVRFFEDDDTDVYIIFEILRSSRLTVSATIESDTSMSMDMASIQEEVGADVAVSQVSGRENLITYKGKLPLTFGFKVFGLAYEEGNWRVQGIAPSPDLSFGTSPLDTHPVLFPLLSRSGRISLK